MMTNLTKIYFTKSARKRSIPSPSASPWPPFSNFAEDGKHLRYVDQYGPTQFHNVLIVVLQYALILDIGSNPACCGSNLIETFLIVFAN